MFFVNLFYREANTILAKLIELMVSFLQNKPRFIYIFHWGPYRLEARQIVLEDV